MTAIRFYVPLMALAESLTAAGQLTGDDEGHVLLDYNPNTGVTTDVGESTPTIRFDRDALAPGGTLTEAADCTIIYVRNPDDFTGDLDGDMTTHSDTEPTYTAATLRDVQPLLTISETYPILVGIFDTGTTDRFWQITFADLDAQIDLAMVACAKSFDIEARNMFETPDVTPQFNSAARMSSGTIHTRNERQLAGRNVVLRFQLINDTDLAALREIYQLTRGSHYPFFMAFDGRALFVKESRMYRFAPSADAHGWQERSPQTGLWNVSIAVERLDRVTEDEVW